MLKEHRYPTSINNISKTIELLRMFFQFFAGGSATTVQYKCCQCDKLNYRKHCLSRNEWVFRTNKGQWR